MSVVMSVGAVEGFSAQILALIVDTNQPNLEGQPMGYGVELKDLGGMKK